MAAAGGVPGALYAPAAAGRTVVPRNTRLSRPAVRCPAQPAPSAGRLRRHHPTGSGGGTVSLRRSAGYRCAVLRGAQRLFSGDGSAHSSRRQHGISPLTPSGAGGDHGAYPAPRDARHGDSGAGNASGTLRGLRGCRLWPCGPAAAGEYLRGTHPPSGGALRPAPAHPCRGAEHRPTAKAHRPQSQGAAGNVAGERRPLPGGRDGAGHCPQLQALWLLRGADAQPVGLGGQPGGYPGGTAGVGLHPLHPASDRQDQAADGAGAGAA